MIYTRVYLCAIPRVVWEQAINPYGVDIARFVQDALGCERRIAKEVNLENEFSRYTLTCQRLEQAIGRSGRMKQTNAFQAFQQTLQSGYFPTQTLDPGYLALLSRTLDKPGWERLGATFFPPDKVSPHRHAFSLWANQEGLAGTPVVEQRLAFLEMVEATGCGLVEVQSGFHSLTAQQQQATTGLDYALAPAEEDEGGFVEIPQFETTGAAVEYFGKTGSKQHQAKILRSQIRQALETGEPVTFGNQAPHDVITQVLYEFVFVPQGTAARPLQLRVTYADGSEAEPFPLFCLPLVAEESTPLANPLRVALMSMRHLELDPEIDLCWFRNREVSRTRTLAETDAFCFQTTLTQLTDSLKPGDLSLQMYQTGFEPAVIGFYRGVVYKLRELRQKQQAVQLAVSPFFFRGGSNYQAGGVWR